MLWTTEYQGQNPRRTHQVLLTDAGESLPSAFAEFWKRILTEAQTLPRGSRGGLSVEILARDGEDPGAATAELLTSQFRRNEEAPRYILRSNDCFVCPRAANEDHRAFLRKHLLWQLEQYAALKQTLHHPDVWPLFQKLNAPDRFRILASGAYDSFEFRPEDMGFGPLSASDQTALAGRKPSIRDAVADLSAGIVDIPPRR